MKKWILALAAPAILLALGGLGMKKIWKNILTAPMAPEKYITEVATGGGIEAKYLAAGGCETAYFEADYPENEILKKSKSGIRRSWKRAAGNTRRLYL